MSDRAYSRVYHSIVDDPKFEHVYDDDRRLATWLRLLIVHEQAHPASAYIPAGTNRAAVVFLANAGLIDLGTGSRYRIHGLDAERLRRSEAARVGGLASGRSRSVERPLNERSTKTNLDETSIDETRRDETSRRSAEPHLEAWLMVKHRPPTEAQRAFLDRYLQVFDRTGPERMAQLILKNPADPIAALKADLDAFRELRLSGLQNGSKPKVKREEEPWRKEQRAAIEAGEARLGKGFESVGEIVTRVRPGDAA